jgi:hypothetical protein
MIRLGVEAKLYTFLISVLDWGEWSATYFGFFTPGTIGWVSTSWPREKNPCPHRVSNTDLWPDTELMVITEVSRFYNHHSTEGEFVAVINIIIAFGEKHLPRK